MKTSTAFNHLSRLIEKLHTCHQYARICGYTNKQLIDSIRENVWEDSAYKKVPGWVRENLAARNSELRNDIYRNWLVWGIWMDGKFFVGWENYPEKAKKEIMENPDSTLQSHYWMKEIPNHGKVWKIAGNIATMQKEITEKHF